MGRPSLSIKILFFPHVGMMLRNNISVSYNTYFPRVRIRNSLNGHRTSIIMHAVLNIWSIDLTVIYSAIHPGRCIVLGSDTVAPVDMRSLPRNAIRKNYNVNRTWIKFNFQRYIN